MGKLHQQSNVRQLDGDRPDSQEPSRLFCWRFPAAFQRISQHLSLRCSVIVILGLAVFLSAVFWVLPMRSKSLGFDAKESVKLNATVQASFRLEKPVSELITHIGRLEYDLYGEIGAPGSKVAVLSMHQSGSSKYTDVVFGVLPDPLNVPIDEVSLILLRLSVVELFLQLTNLTLTKSTFGQTSDFQILKFPGGVAVAPERSTFIGQMPQFLFNFSLNNSISDIKGNSIKFRKQLEYGLHLEPYENVSVVVTNAEGSTLAPSVTVQATVVSDLGSLLPERMKELAETIKTSSSNLGLDNSQFGKVNSVMLSSFLNRTIADISPSPTPAPSPEPGPSASPSPAPSSYPPVQSPNDHPAPHCVNCEVSSPSPTTEPNSPVHCVPPAQSPDAHCRASPRISPQTSPFRSNQASPPVFPPFAYAPASHARNRGNGGNLVSPSLPPSLSSWAVQHLSKEIWLLGFSVMLVHLLCCMYQ
ncbi:hypothetical protein SAY87_018812 [Trapa incisa]|uniref:DUF7036 domain-containing protein n=1 Tax=Trapa incisa TaxID=236973 RepID=A0AAN7K0I2_9MYRT|nr:hypothetical protein SAY87_018812 [Trapa incisa]